VSDPRISDTTQRHTRALLDYLQSDLGRTLGAHRKIEPSAHAIALFREVAATVPAYRQFLAAASIDPAKVQSAADFEALPPTSKANYHRRYPLAELCREGTLATMDFLAVSSGSTGEPTFWPRAAQDEFGTSYRFEQVLADSFGVQHQRTLGVICFSLGSWVGGMYTTFACRNVAAKGYPLTLVTPGNQRGEILRVVRALGEHFEQIVLFGYPPFLKDVIDAGRAEGLPWGQYNVKLVTAGEVFSEEWRALVCERLGASDPARATASLYGTADGGVLANETPLSIRVRRFLAEHPAAARELFGESRLPTLCQYDPLHRYFERNGDNVLFSGDGGVPLIRYQILDRGGVLPFATLRGFLRDHGWDPLSGAPDASQARELPFVYVFGRTGFALSFYGANVYPENIAVGLEQPDIAEHVTGKFVMQLARTADEDVELEVVVELANGAEPSAALELLAQRSLRQHLERQNSEFLHYAPADRRTPRVRLLPLGDAEYFPVGVKHRYTR
jgi:phenylacetate-CoA ligase